MARNEILFAAVAALFLLITSAVFGQKPAPTNSPQVPSETTDWQAGWGGADPSYQILGVSNVSLGRRFSASDVERMLALAENDSRISVAHPGWALRMRSSRVSFSIDDDFASYYTVRPSYSVYEGTHTFYTTREDVSDFIASALSARSFVFSDDFQDSVTWVNFSNRFRDTLEQPIVYVFDCIDSSNATGCEELGFERNDSAQSSAARVYVMGDGTVLQYEVVFGFDESFSIPSQPALAQLYQSQNPGSRIHGYGLVATGSRMTIHSGLYDRTNIVRVMATFDPNNESPGVLWLGLRNYFESVVSAWSQTLRTNAERETAQAQANRDARALEAFQ